MNNTLITREEVSQPVASRDVLPRPSRSWQWLVPAAILLLGFVLRICRISHESVDGDEAFSMTISQLPQSEMIHRLVEDYVHPPLHYFMLRAWFKLFGFGVLQARLLSALFSGLSIVLIYVFARYFFERRTALLSSLLLAISQLTIMFAQQARPYELFHFLMLCSCYLFVRALHEQQAFYWWSFVGSSVLMLYSDYFAIFVIAGLALYAFIYRRQYPLSFSGVLGGLVMGMVLFVPWAASGIVHQAIGNPKTFGGTAWWSSVNWYTLFTAVNSFNNGKPAGLRQSSPFWTFVAGGLLFGVPVLMAMKNLLLAKGGRRASQRLDQQGTVLVSILWLLPLCLVIALCSISHIPYNVRYVLFCAAPYYVLVARGISQVASAVWRWGLVLFIVAYSANALQANYFLPWKENWQDAFAYVEHNRKQQDCGIFLPASWGTDPAEWTITRADRQPPFKVITPENLSAESAQCSRIWEINFLPHNSEDWKAPAEADARPLQQIYERIEQKRFFGVLVGLYVRKEK